MPKKGSLRQLSAMSYGKLVFCKHIFQPVSETWQDPVEYHLLYAQALHHVVQVGAIYTLKPRHHDHCYTLSTTFGDDFGQSRQFDQDCYPRNNLDKLDESPTCTTLVSSVFNRIDKTGTYTVNRKCCLSFLVLHA